MAKKSSKPSLNDLVHFKHHLLPSTFGGGAAFLLTGIAMIGVAVFAAVWIGNMLNHSMHKKS